MRSEGEGAARSEAATGTAEGVQVHADQTRLALALEAGRMGAWEWDIGANTVDWSPQLQALHGLTPGAFDGTFAAFQQDIHPEERERVFATVARTLETGADYQIEYRIVRPDGEIRWVEARGRLFRKPDGAPDRMVGICMDVSGRKAAEARITALNDDLRRRLEELETLMAALPVGVFISRDPKCEHITMNAAGAALLRLPGDANASKSGPRARELPFRVLRDGTELAPEDLPMQRAARLGQSVGGEELDLVFADGEGATLYEYAAPLFDDSGAVRGGLGVFIDITERKRVEQQQKLLLDELNHRVKNTLAIVQSMADQTLRELDNPATFKAAFAARLSALARAHSLLTRQLWQGAQLADVALAVLAPFGAAEDGQGVISHGGPPATIQPNAAVALSLVLHEMATNAAKHGALSAEGGAVRVSWDVEGSPPWADLSWTEEGGPAVSPPTRRGFGSRLLEASAAQLGGTSDVDYAPEGVRVRLRFPLER